MADLHDIETRDDCELLVRTFYGQAMTDHLIGYLFTDIAKLDLTTHIPRITDFWETILLGGGNYRGGAFRVHYDLHRQSPLQTGHFDRWLVLWRASVDACFQGPRAELAKAHALRVARAFSSRLETLDAAEQQPQAGGFLVVQHGPAPH